MNYIISQLGYSISSTELDTIIDKIINDKSSSVYKATLLIHLIQRTLLMPLLKILTHILQIRITTHHSNHIAQTRYKKPDLVTL